MADSYIPKVQEGIYPSDGGWLEEEGKNPTLVLVVPEFGHFVHMPVPKFDYAWLQNQELNAYIFCFRIQGVHQIEKAIIFHEDHAGLLLKEPYAHQAFDILITSVPLDEVKDDTKYLYLPNITIKR